MEREFDCMIFNAALTAEGDLTVVTDATEPKFA